MQNGNLDPFIYTYCMPSLGKGKEIDENECNDTKLKDRNSRESASTWKSDSTSLRKEFWLKTHLITEYSEMESINSETDINQPQYQTSNLSPNHKKIESAKCLLDQLKLKTDKYTSLMSYYNSIKSKLKTSIKNSISELESKKNSLIAEINFKFEHIVNEVKIEERIKLEKILEKEEDANITIEKINSIIKRIQSRLESNIIILNEELLEETKRILKKLDPECKLNFEYAKFESPNLNLRVTDETDMINDSGVLNKTVTVFPFNDIIRENNQEIKKKNSPKHRHKASQEIIRDEWLDNIPTMKRTDVISERRHKRVLSTPITYNIDKASNRKIKISTLISEETRSRNLKKNQIKAYVPYGYPEYSCYYIITCELNSDSKYIISSLKSHIKSQDSYKLYLQTSISASLIELKSYECPLLMYQQSLGFPRLYLKR